MEWVKYDYNNCIGKAALQESKQQKVANICKVLKLQKNKKIRNFITFLSANI
jgi:hypothetical protein